MTDTDRDDDLRDRVAELEATLDELHARLDADPDRRARSPGPAEWLRTATAEVGIPATIAVLETNVRVLESLQRGLRRDRRPADRGPPDTDRLGAASVDRIDRGLADIQSAIDRGALPGQPEARRLVREARQLNAEVRDRLGERAPDPDAGDDGDGAITIDVESELDAIRDDVSGEDDE